MLLQRQSLDPNNEEEPPRRPAIPPSTRPFKPIVLTRDQLQAKVIGQGYPSVSTMTVDEFYQSLAERGLAPTPEQAKQMSSGRIRLSIECTSIICLLGPKLPTAHDLEKEEVAKEAHVEADHPDMLSYMRTKDDYLDEHRRGEGNRHNRS